MSNSNESQPFTQDVLRLFLRNRREQRQLGMHLSVKGAKIIHDAPCPNGVNPREILPKGWPVYVGRKFSSIDILDATSQTVWVRSLDDNWPPELEVGRERYSVPLFGSGVFEDNASGIELRVRLTGASRRRHLENGFVSGASLIADTAAGGLRAAHDATLSPAVARLRQVWRYWHYESRVPWKLVAPPNGELIVHGVDEWGRVRPYIPHRQGEAWYPNLDGNRGYSVMYKSHVNYVATKPERFKLTRDGNIFGTYDKHTVPSTYFGKLFGSFPKESRPVVMPTKYGHQDALKYGGQFRW